MPQLDFREALSTPDQKFFSPAASATAIAAAVPVDQRAEYFARGFGFTRATWANIVFVAIASIGGLVCAFYFFNGGELLRAAASWPSEFLYPRPLSIEKIDVAQLPDPVDQFARNETSSSNAEQAKATSENNGGPSNFSQPATSIGTAAPTGTSPVDGGTPVFPPSPPIPPPVSLPTTPTLPISPTLPITPALPGTPSLPETPSLPSIVKVPPTPLLDSLVQPLGFQSLYQTKPLMAANDATSRSTKDKISSSKKKVASTTKKISTTSANATIRNMQQQGANQTQLANQTQMGGLNHAPNQIMTGGGLGGGLGAGGPVGGGGAVGGGLGGVTGVGGVGGGLGGIGGLNGGGLGGGISGTLGGVGGVLGGKH